MPWIHACLSRAGNDIKKCTLCGEAIPLPVRRHRGGSDSDRVELITIKCVFRLCEEVCPAGRRMTNWGFELARKGKKQQPLVIDESSLPETSVELLSGEMKKNIRKCSAEAFRSGKWIRLCNGCDYEINALTIL